jgi:hypothetical protein
MDFVFIYEIRRMKPAEIVIKRGRMMERVNPTKTHM